MTQTPSHPGFFHVERNDGDFSSRLVADQAFAIGNVIVSLQGLTPGPKRYSSVQISRDDHVELNSDLLFLNHACDPNTFLDVDKRAIVAIKPIAKGDEINFFYPSTEWDMAQPFDCWCGSPKCIKKVQGAKHIPSSTLRQFQLARHIDELLSERDQSS
ncbi:hypothetical protein BC940DRAFT_287704 [Gongronella butleri]|nr:hypothetical protein BC940DRAFT_287704 [Gongronella butleri]